MKDIDKQDQQDVSGGYRPGDGGCVPTPIDYPRFPIVNLPDSQPYPDPLADSTSIA